MSRLTNILGYGLMVDDKSPDLMDPEYKLQSHSFYRELRSCFPVHKLVSAGFDLVLSNSHVREELRDSDLFLIGVNFMALVDGGSVGDDIIDFHKN